MLSPHITSRGRLIGSVVHALVWCGLSIWLWTHNTKGLVLVGTLAMLFLSICILVMDALLVRGYRK